MFLGFEEETVNFMIKKIVYDKWVYIIHLTNDAIVLGLIFLPFTVVARVVAIVVIIKTLSSLNNVILKRKRQQLRLFFINTATVPIQRGTLYSNMKIP
jgi:hypothetical protein